MSCCGKGKLVTIELCDHRLITLDLDCDEDWGDVRITPGNRIGNEKIEIGNEEDGYVEAIRFFEELEKDEDDYIQNKWQTFAIVNKDDFIEWVLMRMICFCEGFGEKDLKEMMTEYGFDYDNLYIPQEWKR